MFFNPIFVQNSGLTETIDLPKQLKLNNPTYLFSDIIKIVNEGSNESTGTEAIPDKKLLNSVQTDLQSMIEDLTSNQNGADSVSKSNIESANFSQSSLNLSSIGQEIEKALNLILSASNQQQGTLSASSELNLNADSSPNYLKKSGADEIIKTEDTSTVESSTKINSSSKLKKLADNLTKLLSAGNPVALNINIQGSAYTVKLQPVNSETNSSASFKNIAEENKSIEKVYSDNSEVSNNNAQNILSTQPAMTGSIQGADVNVVSQSPSSESGTLDLTNAVKTPPEISSQTDLYGQFGKEPVKGNGDSKISTVLANSNTKLNLKNETEPVKNDLAKTVLSKSKIKNSPVNQHEKFSTELAKDLLPEDSSDHTITASFQTSAAKKADALFISARQKTLSTPTASSVNQQASNTAQQNNADKFVVKESPTFDAKQQKEISSKLTANLVSENQSDSFSADQPGKTFSNNVDILLTSTDQKEPASSVSPQINKTAQQNIADKFVDNEIPSSGVNQKEKLSAKLIEELGSENQNNNTNADPLGKMVSNKADVLLTSSGQKEPASSVSPQINKTAQQNIVDKEISTSDQKPEIRIINTNSEGNKNVSQDNNIKLSSSDPASVSNQTLTAEEKYISQEMLGTASSSEEKDSVAFHIDLNKPITEEVQTGTKQQLPFFQEENVNATANSSSFKNLDIEYSNAQSFQTGLPANVSADFGYLNTQTSKILVTVSKANSITGINTEHPITALYSKAGNNDWSEISIRNYDSQLRINNKNSVYNISSKQNLDPTKIENNSVKNSLSETGISKTDGRHLAEQNQKSISKKVSDSTSDNNGLKNLKENLVDTGKEVSEENVSRINNTNGNLTRNDSIKVTSANNGNNVSNVQMKHAAYAEDKLNSTSQELLADSSFEKINDNQKNIQTISAEPQTVATNTSQKISNSADNSIQNETPDVQNKNINIAKTDSSDRQSFQQDEKQSSENQSTDKKVFTEIKNVTSQNFVNDLSAVKKNETIPQAILPPDDKIKTVKPDNLVNEISRIIQQGDTKSAVLKLDPETLGKVKIVLDVVDKNVHANIQVENESAKQIVQNNINDLKQSLNLNGLQLSSVNVSLSSNEDKTSKPFVQKKKSAYGQYERKIEDTNSAIVSKSMGYNTYDYLI